MEVEHKQRFILVVLGGVVFVWLASEPIRIFCSYVAGVEFKIAESYYAALTTLAGSIIGIFMKGYTDSRELADKKLAQTQAQAVVDSASGGTTTVVGGVQ